MRTELFISQRSRLCFRRVKIPFVLSLDDLSYYHSYDGRGIASKMVLDENGKPTCEYIQDDGSVITGGLRLCSASGSVSGRTS